MREALVLVGASGAGKTTVAQAIIENGSKFLMVRSVTTRAPRGDSHDGEYIYKTRDEFLKMVQDSELLEYMEYGDNLYGTPKSEVDRIFSTGKIPLFILDLEGVKSLRSKDIDFKPIVVYIWSDLDEVESRLYSRDLKVITAEKLVAVKKRTEMNVRDYLEMPKLFPLFDAFAENIQISKTAQDVTDLFFSFSRGRAADFESNRLTAEWLFQIAKQKKPK